MKEKSEPIEQTGSRRLSQPKPRDPASAYRRIAVLIITLILVPSALLIAVGILLFVHGSRDVNLVFGILVLVFCGILATGITLIWFFIAKEQGLSQLQTDFVSKVSHELKTPLTSIRLFVETLQLRRANPEQFDQCLAQISKETDRLTDRINQLLEWGRMEAGRKKYNLSKQDVRLLVQEATTNFQQIQLFSDADVRLTLPDAPAFALIDAHALTTALMNLLTNAYKYGGSPRTIRVHVSEDVSKKRIHISVQDNGEGIPRAEHKRIFEKFYRRDDRLSRTHEGSGLGLTIVKHIAKGHKGKIQVSDADGGGACFALSIPLAK